MDLGQVLHAGVMRINACDLRCFSPVTTPKKTFINLNILHPRSLQHCTAQCQCPV